MSILSSIPHLVSFPVPLWITCSRGLGGGPLLRVLESCEIMGVWKRVNQEIQDILVAYVTSEAVRITPRSLVQV